MWQAFSARLHGVLARERRRWFEASVNCTGCRVEGVSYHSPKSKLLLGLDAGVGYVYYFE